MPSLLQILKLSLSFLATSRAQGLPRSDEGTDTWKSGLASKAAETIAIETLPHDAVVSMPQLVPAGMDGTLYLTYQPRLRVKNGCVPFPAVDVQGRIGRGLKATGEPGGSGSKCNKSPGQVYVRSAPVGKWFALMYTWYQPKDQTDVWSGTRHDWEGVVLYIKDRNATNAANVVAVCPSHRGRYACRTAFSLDDTSPLVVYGTYEDPKWADKQHSIYLTNNARKKQPLVAWESMPDVAREALSHYDYGKVQVPFIDGNFQVILGRAIPPPEYVQTLPHDYVVAMPQLTPAGMDGTLYLTYQPRLQVLHGCVPFPAVDVDGRVGRGLKPTGPSGGRHSKCHQSIGQVYVRSGQRGNFFVLLYTWYQPKDQRGRHGKRNDWEGVLVYLKSRHVTDAANIYAVCPSALGEWTCSTDFSLDGTFPLIEYTIRSKSTDNTCYLSTLRGTQHPLVAWESMPKAAAKALSLYDFGKTVVPFIDANFNATVARAIPPV